MLRRLVRVFEFGLNGFSFSETAGYEFLHQGHRPVCIGAGSVPEAVGHIREHLQFDGTAGFLVSSHELLRNRHRQVLVGRHLDEKSRRQVDLFPPQQDLERVAFFHGRRGQEIPLG